MAAAARFAAAPRAAPRQRDARSLGQGIVGHLVSGPPLVGTAGENRMSSRASAATAQDARSLLRQWRRRLPDAHRRRDVADPVGDRRQHARDGPAALRARSRLRRGTRPKNLPASHAELDPHGASRCGARPGKGILGRIAAAGVSLLRFVVAGLKRAAALFIRQGRRRTARDAVVESRRFESAEGFDGRWDF
jgi:hypothetical protein